MDRFPTPTGFVSVAASIVRRRPVAQSPAIVKSEAATACASRGLPRRRSLVVDADGCARGARCIASPNCDDRPKDTPISLVVVHGISLPPGNFGGDAIERLFTNRLDPRAHPYFEGVTGLRVSAHFLIRRDGDVVQFVPCGRRAWHAGQSTWRGVARCNDYSIGIELEGTDVEPYADPQYAALARLCRALIRRYPIDDIVGHSDIAPGRKSDPGHAFDWARLERALRRPLRKGS
jgi:N-acetyl-anhydromuramoyl-L-alanine amidase